MKVITDETIFKFITHKSPLWLEELKGRTIRLNYLLRVTKLVEVEESGFEVRSL